MAGSQDIAGFALLTLVLSEIVLNAVFYRMAVNSLKAPLRNYIVVGRASDADGDQSTGDVFKTILNFLHWLAVVVIQCELVGAFGAGGAVEVLLALVNAAGRVGQTMVLFIEIMPWLAPDTKLVVVFCAMRGY